MEPGAARGPQRISWGSGGSRSMNPSRSRRRSGSKLLFVADELMEVFEAWDVAVEVRL